MNALRGFISKVTVLRGFTPRRTVFLFAAAMLPMVAPTALISINHNS